MAGGQGTSQTAVEKVSEITVTFSELIEFTFNVCIRICKYLFAYRFLSLEGGKRLAQVPKI